MLRFVAIPLGLLVLLIGAMLWSFRAGDPPADVRFTQSGELSTLDLNRISWQSDIRVTYALWEGLYTLNPATGQAIAGTASGCDISADGRQYTFHIRPEARWNNSDPVTGDDFIFAWRRMLESPEEYTHLFHAITGAKAFQEAYAADPAKADFKTVGLASPNPQTLVVKLDRRVPYFLDLVAFTPFFPSHQASMAKWIEKEPDGKTHYKEQFTRAGELVTNGPYFLKRWDFKQRVRMEANPYYWDRQHVGPKSMELVESSDPLGSYLMYHRGRVDWMLDVLPALAAEMRQQGRGDLRIFPGFGTYFYSLNCQKTLEDGKPNPLHDPRVRQALALAIDRKPIVQTITRLGEPEAMHFIPPGIFAGYPSPVGLEYNPGKARKLLAEAGYRGGAGLNGLSILFNTGAQHGDVAQIIRRQWIDELGVTVLLEAVEPAGFRPRMNKKQYTIARASWIGDYGDPSTFTDKYVSTSRGNDAGWNSPAYDALVERAAVEPDAKQRMLLLSQAEEQLLTEMPIIPIYHYSNQMLVSDKLQKVPMLPRNMFPFQQIEVEKK